MPRYRAAPNEAKTLRHSRFGRVRLLVIFHIVLFHTMYRSVSRSVSWKIDSETPSDGKRVSEHENVYHCKDL